MDDKALEGNLQSLLDASRKALGRFKRGEPVLLEEFLEVAKFHFNELVDIVNVEIVEKDNGKSKSDKPAGSRRKRA